MISCYEKKGKYSGIEVMKIFMLKNRSHNIISNYLSNLITDEDLQQ